MQVKTYRQLVNRFLKWAATCRKPATVAVYRHYLRKFAKTHGNPRLSDITPAKITAWAKTWHDVQALKRLFRWGVEEALLITSNPAAGVKHPPKGMRRRIHSRSELVRLLRYSRPDARAIFTAYAETYARPQELRAACFEDLHADDPRISIRAALPLGRVSIVLWDFKNRADRRDPDRPRVILLSPRVGRLVARLWDRRAGQHGPIFVTSRGRAWSANALRCRFRRMRAKLDMGRDHRGENFVPYTFRHTGATLAAAEGVRDRVLADVLGHVETKTTARYQHLATEHLQGAMAQIWERKQRRRDDRRGKV